jgi:4-aminobutyrate aminotransferase-like enzyme
MGDVLRSGLEELKSRHVCVGDARAIGLFSCLDLVADRDTKEPLPLKHAGEISRRLMDRGLYSPIGSMQPLTLFFVAPPLSIDEGQLQAGLAIIDEVLDYVDTLVDD